MLPPTTAGLSFSLPVSQCHQMPQDLGSLSLWITSGGMEGRMTERSGVARGCKLCSLSPSGIAFRQHWFGGGHWLCLLEIALQDTFSSFLLGGLLGFIYLFAWPLLLVLSVCTMEAGKTQSAIIPSTACGKAWEAAWTSTSLGLRRHWFYSQLCHWKAGWPGASRILSLCHSLPARSASPVSFVGRKWLETDGWKGLCKC